MEQKDYVEKEIEKLSLILNKLLSKIIKSNKTESSNYLAEEVNTTLIDKFNLSNIEFEKLNSEDLIQTLLDKKKISCLHLEDLANIFYELAKTSINETNKNTFKNCLTIYNHLEKSEGIFSFERNQKINEIKHLLNL